MEWLRATLSAAFFAANCRLVAWVACLGTCMLSGSVLAANAPAYYFSDCQSGAHAACVAGRNSNAGTDPAKPKQNLNGMDLSALPANTQLLFARGGVWTGFSAILRNLNAKPNQPIVFDSYAPPWGGTEAPWLQVTSFIVAFQLGQWGDVENDGGYTIRNLKLDGVGKADWGVWLRTEVRNVTLENLEITGFKIGVHSQSEGASGNTFLTLRNSNIHHNSGMGFLGDASDLTIEGNTFAANNITGTTFNHAIYLSGQGRNGVLRNNTFTDNSVANGMCRGGNVTVHGQWDGLLIEGNTISQVASADGCWGFSITPGYSSKGEWFRNVVVRNNTLVNLGGCAVCVISAPGVVIEGNRIFNNQASQIGVVVGKPTDPSDDPGDKPVVRNNIVCFKQPNGNSAAVALRVSGGVETGTVYRTGPVSETGACAR
ncbi:right-handed parallel beta-helix repeat-containing protein [Sphaerotilaceae bacterium SBD11-9]